MNSRLRGILVLLAGALVYPAGAEVVAPGVEYLTYTTTQPNRVYVLRMERARPELMVHMGFPQKRRNYTSRQTVSTIASSYDSGPAFDVLGAVNASFFGTGNAITGGLGSEGSVIQPVGGFRETLLLSDARVPEIVNKLNNTARTLRFSDGSTTNIEILNLARPVDALALYTPQWGPGTATTAQGLEIVLTNVNYPLRGDKWVGGTVSALRTGPSSVNNTLAANTMILSAHGRRAADLISKVAVGDRLEVQIDLNYNRVSTAATMITGAGWLLNAGAANTANWTSHAFAPERHPRTVFAWNATYIFLVAFDGRRPGVSVGMTFAEMASFLSETLGATDALNLDGGGSTTMVVNGAVKNQPSDGSQRAVSNAMMLVRKTESFQPFSDPFTASGRSLQWDDKYRFNPVVPFSPPSPSGDGYALHLKSLPERTQESCRVGRPTDTDYAVEADIYFDYRTGDIAGDEVVGIFARDNGNAYWSTNAYDGGQCYAMAYAADSGTLSVGLYADGPMVKLGPDTPVLSSGWHTMRIECRGATIRYLLDGALVSSVTDPTYTAGFAGVAVSESYSAYGDVRGVYADNFKMQQLPVADVVGWEIY